MASDENVIRINTFRKGGTYEETDIPWIHLNKMEENVL